MLSPVLWERPRSFFSSKCNNSQPFSTNCKTNHCCEKKTNGALALQQIAKRNLLWAEEHNVALLFQQEIHCEPENTIEWVFPTNCNKKSIVSRGTQWSLLFQQIATRNPLWAEEHNGACFSNKLQQEIHCEQKNTMELAFPTNCNKRAWALDSFTIVPGSLGVQEQVHTSLSIHEMGPASWLWNQMLKFEEHQGESSTKFLHSIPGMPCIWDFQIILSTKCKTESVLAAWRNKRGHVKMEEFIAKWVLEVEIGKFLWARYCSQNTSCPFPSSSGFPYILCSPKTKTLRERVAPKTFHGTQKMMRNTSAGCCS